MLSFVPAGMVRSAAEYIAAVIPGSILLFAFFIAAEVAMVVVKDDIIVAVFLPVVCIMPLLAGAISTLVLEKVRKKPLTLQRGALVGAAAGLSGALVSSVALVVVGLLTKQSPFGGMIKDLLVYVALLAIVAIDTVLGAAGGAILVKVIKQPPEQAKS